ncbi:MAG: acetyl-CoA carboxylase biotin carboxylase subunit [Chitinophagaceae bacterium]|nr:MAG: acetyl-CoA carboxylase biotin carboxylase subunit [Chitinophagaceae bacterium]
MTKKISRILVANRGEIACRIFKSCQKMGIETVAVFSDADRDALHVEKADLAVYLGESEASKSYLDMDKIIAAARKTKADAIHPGYGFLSENAEFAKKTEDAGFIFIGPNTNSIEKMGSKKLAKEIAEREKVPVIPGYNGKNQDIKTLVEEALKIGFPLLIKASAGGGGKGMRIVRDKHQLEDNLLQAKSESKSAFGNDTLIIEKYIEDARHIEIQILGDKHGNIIHLFERECTIQRRYQKIIEESPSPVLDETVREKMCSAALKLAKALKYDNAGTVEFVYSQGEFYFLEVNTRLQVEHPVTEAITDIDLIEWQIRIAQGDEIKVKQEELQQKGYAIECRIYAEDPLNNFMPSPGKISLWTQAENENIRYDAGVKSGEQISPFYDPLLCKIIAKGNTRMEAINTMIYSLKQTKCLGIKTNQLLLIKLLEDSQFQAGEYNTKFLDSYDIKEKVKASKETTALALITVSLKSAEETLRKRQLLKELPFSWRNNFYKPTSFQFTIDGEEHSVSIKKKDLYEIGIGKDCYQAELSKSSSKVIVDGIAYSYTLVEEKDEFFLHFAEFPQICVIKGERFPDVQKSESEGAYTAGMPATVVKVNVSKGEKIKKGQLLLIFSSMKMEQNLYAHIDGIVDEVNVKPGEQVDAGKEMLRITPLNKTEK